MIGNRNWHPFIAETLQGLADSGARRLLVMFTAAYSSYSGCRQYREDLARALAQVVVPEGEALVLDKIGPYAESTGFVDASARSVVEALTSRDQDFLHQARVLFVTHSIPTAMDAGSGPGGPEGTYSAQHRRVATRVMDAVASELGFAPVWEIAYCSRSGVPHIPWLEPDVNDRMTELASQGVRRVVAVPFGFINDHMEVVYDLDTQARETADAAHLEYVRAATVGTDPAFVDELVGRLLERAAVARGETPEPLDSRYLCAPGCCRGGRPGAPDLPAVFQATV